MSFRPGKGSAKGSPKKNKSKSAPPSSAKSGAFVFKDRSGKEHAIGSGGASRRTEREEGAASGAGERPKKGGPGGFLERFEYGGVPPKPPVKTPDQVTRFEPKKKKKHGDPAQRESVRHDDRKERRERPGKFAKKSPGVYDRDSKHKVERKFDRKFDRKGKPGRGRDESRFDRGGHHERGDRSESKFHGKRGRDSGRKNRFDTRIEGGRSRRDVDLSSLDRVKAIVDKNRKGFAFLLFEKKQWEDAFINPREAERFFHGDRVEVAINDDGEVMDIRVIEHRFRELVGRYYPVGKTGMVVYERKKAREEIRLQGTTLGAKSRDWVRAKIHFEENEHGDSTFTAEIVEVYGPELPPAADIQMVAAEYNLIEEHSKAAVEEAEGFKLDRNDPDRVDLTHVPLITIDGETARDFDDAVYVERHRDGHVLWVAIADVSHYVTAGTNLDDEAKSRGTSVYFPERAFHMLPRALSENLCSLKPKELRLSMVAKMEFDKKGVRRSVEVMNALIESKRRATYTEIQAEWEANRENPNWEYAAHFELYQKIRKARADRGSIDFDLPEAELRVKPTGEPISIKNRPRLDAHRLIEEFMIAANEAVTDYAIERGWPFVYRVHAEPVTKALIKFQELSANSGVNFVLNQNDVAGSLNALIRSLEGHPSQTLLNTALLRSMAQAMYSSVYGEHFGLASKGYTHFTSPIRRYPDLVVHRILKEILKYEKAGKALSEDEMQEWEENLAEITEHCSYRERIAAEAERESIKLKQVRIMLPEVGNEFDGKVNGMMENGLFIVLKEPFVEGVVSKESMVDDSYEFHEEKMLFVGRRKKRTYRIGQEVRIRVERVDIDLRMIDFAFVDNSVKL